MTPPPNPHATAARAAMQAQFAAVDAARRAGRNEASPLYPLDERLEIWRYVVNDCGIDIVIDDPANLFSGW